MPERIQRRRVKGWRMPEGARYVGRGSEWGNPYVVGAMVMIETPSIFDRPDGGTSRADYCYGLEITPEIAVLLHRIWVADRLEEQIRAEMAGQDLVCWCPLDRPCHADTYLEIANGSAGAHQTLPPLTDDDTEHRSLARGAVARATAQLEMVHGHGEYDLSLPTSDVVGEAMCAWFGTGLVHESYSQHDMREIAAAIAGQVATVLALVGWRPPERLTAEEVSRG